MECDKVQDRLMGEYVDKELGPEEYREVERHMASCLDCQEFFEGVQKSAVIPFQRAGEMQPDGVVWQRIQEKIEAEPVRFGNGFGKLAEAMALLLRIPQPILRVAFATALILGVVLLAKWPVSYTGPTYGYISEQMNFMSGLKAGNTDLLTGDLKDDDAVFEEVGA
jgi:anti-sigma factor RsiW